ncbi:MAG: SDR family NAD(P)-dependent oxidoreductase [Solirubrobacterales bacterium]
MAKTLVTGASGFVGSHLARALAQRGDELVLLLRKTADVSSLENLEFTRVTGDVTDRRAVRRAMAGAERVFHAAGLTSLRAADREAVFETNVKGTRVVLSAALEAGVKRAVLTSSVAAIGPAKPHGTADEEIPFTAGRLGIAYVNSKHESEVEAMRLAVKGLPLVIVNPTFVLGPDSPGGSSMHLVRRFLLGRIPAYINGALNIVDVRDVATGHLLAERKGEVGERYILGGRNFTLDRLFADLSRISGVPAPELRLPAELAARGAELALRARLPTTISPDEVRSGGLWWTYRNTKAKRELGFKPRPHEETLEDAVRWQSDILGDRVGAGGGPERRIFDAAGRAMRLTERVWRR